MASRFETSESAVLPVLVAWHGFTPGVWTTVAVMKEHDHRAKALEIAVHLAVIAIIVLGAFWIFSPFVMVVLWAIVLAVTFYPLFGMIRKVVGDRRKLAGSIFIVLSLAVILLPAAHELAAGGRHGCPRAGRSGHAGDTCPDR